jgi:hypothetical protein
MKTELCQVLHSMAIWLRSSRPDACRYLADTVCAKSSNQNIRIAFGGAFDSIRLPENPCC